MRLEDSLRSEAEARFLVADQLVLDCADRRAWMASAKLDLGAKALSLLEELMQQPQLLVTKDRLFDVGWPDQAVSDAVLTTAIRELRRALGDPARSPKWIETHHGEGYRFLKKVERRAVHPGRLRTVTGVSQQEDSGDAPKGISLRLAAIALGLILSGVAVWFWQQRAEPEIAAEQIVAKSVVALPFAPIGEGAGVLASGLDEEIATTLARTPDIELAGAAVVAEVASAGSTANTVGRKAGFGHILSGSVRIVSDQVRVNAKLTDTKTGRELWSERFDRPAKDIIALQEDVAFAIAQAVGSVMDPARLREMTRIGTRSVEAYRAWRKGRELVERAVVNSDASLMDEARASYARAQKLDPQFARAHWEAAYMELMTANTIYADTSDPASDEGRKTRYIENVEAAIDAAPNDTDRLLYRAAREVADFNYRESVRLLERYLQQRPRDTDIWYSFLEQSRIAERYDLVEKAIAQIIALERKAGTFPVIGTNYMDHDPGLALRYAEDAMREAPDYTALQFQAHRAYLIAGKTSEARALLDRMTRGELPLPIREGAKLRQLCAEGKNVEAQKLARALVANVKLPLVVRWSSANTAGLDEAARQVLGSLEGRDATFTLGQFLIYRDFDARKFPEVRAALARAGIDRPPPRKPNYACT
ncbi:MAG: winged helix-turn-helix domain-containing protein [Erythrobacter sp.]